MDLKIKETSENLVEESDVGSLKKYLNKLSKSLFVSNNRQGRDSKISDLKWLFEMESDENEKKKIFTQIKSLMLSDIERVVDTDSDNEPPKKKREIRNTLQSISILNEPLPSPIREDWNSDNESFSNIKTIIC